MRNRKLLLLILLTSISLTAYSWQGTHGTDTLKVDSTRILGAPVYVWNQIFRDLATLDAGKLYIMQLEVEVKKASVLQAKSDIAIEVAENKATAAKKEASSYKAMYELKDKQNEQANKEKRRYKRERDISIGGIVIVLVLGLMK